MQNKSFLMFHGLCFLLLFFAGAVTQSCGTIPIRHCENPVQCYFESSLSEAVYKPNTNLPPQKTKAGNLEISVPHNWYIKKATENEDILLTFYNETGQIEGKVFTIQDKYPEEESLINIFLAYLNSKMYFEFHDFISMVGRKDKSAYIVKTLYRRQYHLFYAILRDQEEKKLYLIKFVGLNPYDIIDPAILSIFYSMKLGGEQTINFAEKYGIRLLGSEGWQFLDTEPEEVFKVYYEEKPTLITLHYIKKYDESENPVDLIKDYIKEFKASHEKDEYEYEQPAVDIEALKGSSIMLKVSNVYSQKKIEVVILKYFFAYNRKLFEMNVFYDKESSDDTLQVKINTLLNSIQFQ